MRIASLGSGSKGNATLVDNGDACLLIDLGFTLKESVFRLNRLGLQPEQVTAILVTHEHADHIHGVAPFARKFGTPVYLSPGTYQAKSMGQLPSLNTINCHAPFSVGSFDVVPVAVPHDAKEPCQYVIHSGDLAVGILTDLGHITPHVRDNYDQCDALFLECNHDLEMLMEGPYPQPLKHRVGGDYGHLNNQQAADLLTDVDLKRLKKLIISHVSEQNNVPELALSAVAPYLEGWAGDLVLADQTSGLSWININ